MPLSSDFLNLIQLQESSFLQVSILTGSLLPMETRSLSSPYPVNFIEPESLNYLNFVSFSRFEDH